jgi:hypothetical protein
LYAKAASGNKLQRIAKSYGMRVLKLKNTGKGQSENFSTSVPYTLYEKILKKALNI